MLAGAIKALNCTRRISAPARLMAVLCTVAILTAGFAHSIHQSNALMPIVAMQSDAGTPNDLPDTPKKLPVVVEHCFGCSMIALADVAHPFVPHRITADLPTRRVDRVRPHPSVVEIPPPIASI